MTKTLVFRLYTADGIILETEALQTLLDTIKEVDYHGTIYRGTKVIYTYKGKSRSSYKDEWKEIQVV